MLPKRRELSLSSSNTLVELIGQLLWGLFGLLVPVTVNVANFARYRITQETDF